MISIKIPAGIVIKADHEILVAKESKTDKATLKRNKVGGHILSDFKTHHKVII